MFYFPKETSHFEEPFNSMLRESNLKIHIDISEVIEVGQSELRINVRTMLIESLRWCSGIAVTIASTSCSHSMPSLSKFSASFGLSKIDICYRLLSMTFILETFLGSAH